MASLVSFFTSFAVVLLSWSSWPAKETTDARNITAVISIKATVDFLDVFISKFSLSVSFDFVVFSSICRLSYSQSCWKRPDYLNLDRVDLTAPSMEFHANCTSALRSFHAPSPALLHSEIFFSASRRFYEIDAGYSELGAGYIETGKILIIFNIARPLLYPPEGALIVVGISISILIVIVIN